WGRRWGEGWHRRRRPLTLTLSPQGRGEQRETQPAGGWSAFQDPGTGGGEGLEHDLKLRAARGFGRGLEAAGVGDEGVRGAGRADAGTPGDGHVGAEDVRAVGVEQGLAGGVADQAALVVEHPLVRTMEFLVDPPGAAEGAFDRLARAGEEDAGGVDHGRQAVR